MLLLVEDHPINREILTRQLEALGFVTDTAGDAEQALERFTATHYGLVFCDLLLPDRRRLRARAATARARAQPRARRTPIVALTASAVRGERERCREAGMDDLVVKPATPATMAATLQRWLPHVAWPPRFDPDVLDELTLGDPRHARERDHPLPQKRCRTDLDGLKAALERGDTALARRRAHQIAGAEPDGRRDRTSPSAPPGWSRPARTSWPSSPSRSY